MAVESLFKFVDAPESAHADSPIAAAGSSCLKKRAVATGFPKCTVLRRPLHVFQKQDGMAPWEWRQGRRACKTVNVGCPCGAQRKQ